MSNLQLAAETVTPAVLSLTVGLAALFTLVLLMARATASPLWSRALWRSMVVAAGLWTGCEVVGGHAFLGRWIDQWRSRPSIQQERPPIGPHAIADTGDLQESFALATEGRELPDPLSWSPAVVEFEAEVQPLAAPRGRESFSQFDVGEPRAAEAKKTPNPFPVAAVVMLAWLAGWMILTVRFSARRILVIYFTRRHTRPAHCQVVEQVGAVVRQLEVATASGQPHPEGTRADLLRRFRIRQTDRLAAPVVYGMLRPTLLVPANFLQFLPRAQREAVVAHELVHIAGRDPLWQAAFDAFAAVAWWHPAVWLARRAHRAACEAAADDGAAALPHGSRALAAALVRLGREITAPPRFGWAALDRRGRRRSRLGLRVLRLLSGEPARRPTRLGRRGFVYSGIVVVTLVTSLLFGTALARSGVSGSSAWKTHNGGHPMAIWQTSWRSSLAAAAIAAMIGTAAADEVEEAANAGEEELVFEGELASEQADESREEAREETKDEKPRKETKVSVLAELAAKEQEAAAKKKTSRADSGVDRHDLANAWRRAEREIELSLNRTKEQIATEPEQISKHLLLLLESARAEAAEGRRESAQEIMEHVRQLAQIWRMRREDRPAHLAQLQLDDEMRSMSEVQRRQHHLIQAAENLKAAGKDNLAEELLREAEEIVRSEPRRVGLEFRVVEEKPVRRVELRSVEGERVRTEARLGPAHPLRAEVRRTDELKTDAGEKSAPTVDQLRREMNELKSQVDEMRAMLQRVVERLERDGENGQVEGIRR